MDSAIPPPHLHPLCLTATTTMNAGLETPSQHNMTSFTLLGPAAAPVMAPRLGRLSIAGRKAISTPHHIPLTTRGAVAHIAHDVMRDQTAISGLYLGLEDFIEKQPRKDIPPLYKVPAAPHESALRKFICMPEDLVLILGPRRNPPVVCPVPNTPDAIAILTSVGFRRLEADEYTGAVRKLKPDIVVGLADLVYGQPPGVKRRAKMVDRTHAFTMDITKELYGEGVAEEERSRSAYFAPVLPLENTQQSLYLEELEDEMRPCVSGLALYEAASLSIVPESLGELPRLLLSAPATPQDILREVSLGADMLTIPFLSTASDAGMALTFSFPSSTSCPSVTAGPLPLALNLWSSVSATDTRPLTEGCQCYACKNHHRAYVKHLLSAKEMLAWTLLQLHNYHTMDLFFSEIRASIQRNTFEQDVQIFEQTYASQLPEKTGEGPRLRGYHRPTSGPNQPKVNPRAYGRLDDMAEKYAESISSVATPDTGANELQERGFAEKSGS